MKKPKLYALVFVVIAGMLFTTLFISCNSGNKETADTVYTNGKIYTVNEKQEWAEAVAIKDGKFIKVGSNAAIEKFIGEKTEVIHLAGKFVMPGIHDVHVHPSYKYAFTIDGQLDFSSTATKEEIQAALKAYVTKHPERKAIRGKQWGHAMFPNGKMSKEFIDAVVKEIPVVLVAESGHNATANSKALEMAGIIKSTPNPDGGVIDWDPKTKGETGISIGPKYQPQLLEYHKAGIQLHFHANGDGTVHEVLNLIEKFQKEFPRPGFHHHIAHCSLVSTEDIQRFKELGVYADFSPALFFPSAFSPILDPLFGEERMQTRWFPIKGFVDAEIVAGYGSDWPLGFPSPSPFPNIEAMATRKDPYGKIPGQLGQPITLAQGIKIFTLGGAQATMQDKESGSIEEGKYADMIVLDRNLFAIPVENIDGTVVLNTIFEGKSVYKK